MLCVNFAVFRRNFGSERLDDAMGSRMRVSKKSTEGHGKRDPSNSHEMLPQDPLGMAGSGINLYGYVGDSPMDAIDPSGSGPGGGGGEGAGAGPGSGECGTSHSSGGRGLWGKIQCTNYEHLDKIEEENHREEKNELLNLEASIAGCIVGGVTGAAVAAYGSAGLATQAGAYGGCFVGGVTVIIIEKIL